MRSARALAAALTLAASGCARGPAWTYTTPAVVSAAALRTELLPRAPERLVLAHFWATW